MPALTDSGLQRLFESTLAAMRGELGGERFLILFDDQVQAAHGLDTAEFWSRAPVSLTLLEKLRRSATPWISGDLQSEPELQDSSSLLLSGIRSVLAAPLLDERSRVRGCLYADHCGRAEAFSRHDLARLTSMARELERLIWAPPETPAPPPRTLPPPPVRRSAAVAPLPPAAPPAPAGGSIAPRQMTIFLRSLAVMTAAGIPLPRVLHVLEGQPELARACASARLAVERGQSLSAALQGASPSFTSFQLRLLKVGERTGSMVEILRHLADYEERRAALSMRLRSALTYPAFLLVACLAMLVLGPPFLLKGQLRMLELAGGELPWLTRMLYAASDPRLLVTLALLGALAGALSLASLRTPAGAERMDRWLLTLRLWRLVVVTRFSQALALQLQVGLSVLEAVPRAAEVSGSPMLVRQAVASVEALRSGSDLAGALEASRFFPTPFLSTVRAGEESGRVTDSLQWIARLYQHELEAALETAVAALEPTIMLLMGLATGLVALATMLPMVRVVQNL